jgi:hypothetical protein
MQDDKYWLLHPVLPRPPALPKFGPELWALIGLDVPESEQSASKRAAKSDLRDTAEARSRRDTEPEALVAASGVHACAPAIRTGT